MAFGDQVMPRFAGSGQQRPPSLSTSVSSANPPEKERGE